MASTSAVDGADDCQVIRSLDGSGRCYVTIRHLGNGSVRALMKVVPSCDKPREGARSLCTWDHRMGPPGAYASFRKEREPPGLKHLSRERKRNQPRYRE